MNSNGILRLDEDDPEDDELEDDEPAVEDNDADNDEDDEDDDAGADFLSDLSRDLATVGSFAVRAGYVRQPARDCGHDPGRRGVPLCPGVRDARIHDVTWLTGRHPLPTHPAVSVPRLESDSEAKPTELDGSHHRPLFSVCMVTIFGFRSVGQ